MEYDYALEFFEPVFQKLDNMVTEVFDDYYELNRSNLAFLSARSRASYVNDSIRFRLFSILSEISQVSIVRFYGTSLVYIHGQCVIRVKKLDNKGRALYNYTQSSLQFDKNQSLLAIPNTDHLYFGYVLDRNTGLPGKSILASPSDTENEPAEWVINITEEVNQQIQFYRPQPYAQPKLRPKVKRTQQERSS